MRDIRQFDTYIEQSEELSLDACDRDCICRYTQYLTNSGKSAATVARCIASLKSFFAYCVSEGAMKENPVHDIPRQKTEKKLPQILTGREVELLLEQPKCTDMKGFRDKAMLETLYATGMRVSELISLNVADVSLAGSFIKCEGNGKFRIIPLYPAAVKALTTYLTDIRPKMVAGPEEEALFVNVNGERMTRQGFWKTLKQYVKEAGITKAVTPHTLRHSFAAHLLENGASMNDIKDILGHTDISSMQMYSKYLKSKLRSTYIMHHPRAKI